MPTDTKLNQLIINQLTQEQYDEAKAAGTLSDTELYITDSDDDPQVKSNLSQTIDDSTTKYPSNKAVKDESSRITTLMDNYVKKSGDTMSGLLDTLSYFRTRGRTTRIIEVNSLDNSQTWGTFEVNKQSNTETTTLLFAFNPSDNNKNATIGIHINGNEKWAQCPASKRQNSIVTSEYMGSNYVRFGNGIQICWFYPQISGPDRSNNTLTLPVAFNNADYLALVQQTGDSPTNDYTNTLSIMSKTTTNFVIRKAMGESTYLQVLCVGYWY